MPAVFDLREHTETTVNIAETAIIGVQVLQSLYGMDAIAIQANPKCRADTIAHQDFQVHLIKLTFLNYLCFFDLQCRDIYTTLVLLKLSEKPRTSSQK